MATASRGIERDIEALRKDIAALASSVNQLANGAADAQTSLRKGAQKAANGAIHAGEEFMSDFGNLGSHSAEVASEMAQTAMSTVAGQIKRNPMAAVVAALGLGFIVGVIGHNR